MLAAASNAVIIGFNVRPQGKATEVADREGVDIRYYSVIYQAIDEIEAALKGMLKPEFEEAAARHGRDPRGLPLVARSATSPAAWSRPGTIRRNSKARLLRDGTVVADNLDISSLRREKDDATEVREGFECGLTLGWLQRHQDRRRHRDVRDEGDPARLTAQSRPVARCRPRRPPARRCCVPAPPAAAVT